MEQLQEERGIESFAYIDYHILGTLRSEASTNRRSYYQGAGTPDVYFDGGDRIVGGRNHESLYRDALDSQSTESPIDVRAEASYDLATQMITVEVNIAVGEDVLAPETCVVRAVLVEDLSNKKIARTMPIEVDLMAVSEGQSQSVVELVSPASHWRTANMHVIAWVQRDNSRAVLNADQSPFGDPTPVFERSWGQIKSEFRPKP